MDPTHGIAPAGASDGCDDERFGQPEQFERLADSIEALLPQTQCRRCGYEGCRPYALALAQGECALNRCPPGGATGIAALAALLGRKPQPLDPACGRESPPPLAWIDPDRCIGCARCLPVCPVDAILGAARQLHTVIESDCTGCELCLPACPVDCIGLAARPLQRPMPPAHENRRRYRHHCERAQREARAREQLLDERKRLARAPAMIGSGGPGSPTGR